MSWDLCCRFVFRRHSQPRDLLLCMRQEKWGSQVDEYILQKVLLKAACTKALFMGYWQRHVATFLYLRLPAIPFHCKQVERCGNTPQPSCLINLLGISTRPGSAAKFPILSIFHNKIWRDPTMITRYARNSRLRSSRSCFTVGPVTYPLNCSASFPIIHDLSVPPLYFSLSFHPSWRISARL